MGFSDASERGSAGTAPNRDGTGDLRPRLAYKFQLTVIRWRLCLSLQ